MQVQPYLFFDGRCEEALDFYRDKVGAEITALMRFSEAPEKSMISPGSENKVMHSSFRLGNTVVMASDGHCQGKAVFNGFALSVMVSSEADAKRTFGALSEGGQVQTPLTKTFFSPAFGMVADRFGVSWMVVVEEKH